MRIGPFLLLGSSHANPQQVGVGTVYGIQHFRIVSVSKLRTVRGRTGMHLKEGIVRMHPLYDAFEHKFRRAEKHHPSPHPIMFRLPLQALHLAGKEVPSGNSPFRTAVSPDEPAGRHDAHPVGQQCITAKERLGKCRVFLRVVVTIGVEGIDEQLAVRKMFQIVKRIHQRHCFQL